MQVRLMLDGLEAGGNGALGIVLAYVGIAKERIWLADLGIESKCSFQVQLGRDELLRIGKPDEQERMHATQTRVRRGITGVEPDGIFEVLLRLLQRVLAEDQHLLAAQRVLFVCLDARRLRSGYGFRF